MLTAATPSPRGQPHLRTLRPRGSTPVSQLSLRDLLARQGPARSASGTGPHCRDLTTSPAAGPSLHTGLPHPHRTVGTPNLGISCLIAQPGPAPSPWRTTPTSRTDIRHLRGGPSESTPFYFTGQIHRLGMSFHDHIPTKTRLLSAPLRPWVHFTALAAEWPSPSAFISQTSLILEA